MENISILEFDQAKNYLIEKQFIDTEIVTKLHNNGLLQQDKRNNLLMIWTEDGKAIGCNELGTTDKSNWKKVQSNSDGNVGFNIRNGDPESIKFFDTGLEMLSYMTLNKEDLQDTWFVSLEGTNEAIVNRYIDVAQKTNTNSLKEITFLPTERTEAKAKYLIANIDNQSLKPDFNVGIIKQNSESWAFTLKSMNSELDDPRLNASEMDL